MCLCLSVSEREEPQEVLCEMAVCSPAGSAAFRGAGRRISYKRRIMLLNS